MRYRVESGVCRIPPDTRMRLTAEQAKPRAHRLVDIANVGETGDVVAMTTTAIEFKAGEIIDLPWRTPPAYLAKIIVPVDLPQPSPKTIEPAPVVPPAKPPAATPSKAPRGA